ncbi:hypothetical protein RCL_jg13908.t1 [Rhizophagus clarus]|uniref:Uncharacterized protein n=1 Tax=Rhizophagus clarus TaxID=94130 RepID=A0A8H3LUS4_9GLOM|nr:hypothetical protein RCL_jg13908.t1 [Rhizophagus clarus]
MVHLRPELRKLYAAYSCLDAFLNSESFLQSLYSSLWKGNMMDDTVNITSEKLSDGSELVVVIDFGKSKFINRNNVLVWICW